MYGKGSNYNTTSFFWCPRTRLLSIHIRNYSFSRWKFILGSYSLKLNFCISKIALILRDSTKNALIYWIYYLSIFHLRFPFIIKLFYSFLSTNNKSTGHTRVPGIFVIRYSTSREEEEERKASQKV